MKKATLTAVIVLMTAACILISFAVGGSQSDPLVSLSGITSAFSDPVNNYLSLKTAALSKETSDRLAEEINKYYDLKFSSQALKTKIYDAAAELAGKNITDRFRTDPTSVISGISTVTLKKGDRIAGVAGSGFILNSGAGNIYCPTSSGKVINVTVGSTRDNGFTIRDGIYYMITANDGSGLVITSESAVVMIFDGAYTIPADNGSSPAVDKVKYADALADLSLFYGTNNGYELERIPTRAEALTMLVRLLGEASAAKSSGATSPFKDLVGWETAYVNYSYQKGYTAGTGATTFSPTLPSSADMYLSFVLRALGYKSGTNNDFIWNATADDLAIGIGLITQSQMDSINKNGFTRGDMVLISCNALFVNLKNSTITLGEKLVNSRVITLEQLMKAYSAVH